MHRIPAWAAVVAGAVIVAAGILFAAGWYDDAAEFWTYAVPGVLTGAGTLALAGVTAVMALGERDERKDLRADRDEARQERNDERARNDALSTEARALAAARARQNLAESVQCKLSRLQYVPQIFLYEENQPSPGAQLHALLIVNAGSSPIRNVSSDWYRLSHSTSDPPLFSHKAESLPENSVSAFQQPQDANLPAGVALVRVTFTDGNGITWQRWTDGRLVEVPESMDR